MGKNRLAVVTGAVRGIGRAIARRLAAAQDLVVIVDLNGAAEERAAAEIRSEYGDAAAAADVSDYRRVENLMGRIHREHGAIDVRVNNAGIIRRETLLSVTERDWDDVIAVNLKGAFNCCKHATPS